MYGVLYYIDMKKTIITDEMRNDFTKMGDKEFASKWHMDRVTVVRIRKREGIKPFNNQHGTKEHKFENEVEYKWCQKGHWETLDKFYKCPSRYDGYRGWCAEHSRKSGTDVYKNSGGKERARKWRNTDVGKLSLRRTWRKERAKRTDAYVYWDRDCEERAYDEFDKRCAYCGIPIEFDTLEFDHFIPVALGGKTKPSNMLPCCMECNHGIGGKFNRDAMDWMSEKFGEDRAILIYRDIKRHLRNLSNVLTKH